MHLMHYTVRAGPPDDQQAEKLFDLLANFGFYNNALAHFLTGLFLLFCQSLPRGESWISSLSP